MVKEREWNYLSPNIEIYSMGIENGFAASQMIEDFTIDNNNNEWED